MVGVFSKNLSDLAITVLPLVLLPQLDEHDFNKLIDLCFCAGRISESTTLAMPPSYSVQPAATSHCLQQAPQLHVCGQPSLLCHAHPSLELSFLSLVVNLEAELGILTAVIFFSLSSTFTFSIPTLLTLFKVLPPFCLCLVAMSDIENLFSLIYCC